MVTRLNTDRSIQPLVAQFVPLKVETKGEQWQQWASQYPFEGKAIPIIYIIRADGKMLYGKSGTKAGPELPQFMVEQLKQSGRTFSDAEIGQLTSTVDAAKELLEAGDKFGAVKRISAISKIGKPGKLESHATIAIEADKIVNKLIDEAKAALAEAEENLASDDKKFEGALGLVETKRVYGTMPALKLEIATAYREHSRDADLEAPLQWASAADRAESYLLLRNGEKMAIEALGKIMTRYSGTPAAQYAARRIEELTGKTAETGNSPAKTVPAETAAGPVFRTWTSSGGGFRVEATLVEVRDGKAVLKRKDGKTFAVPVEKLSKQDQDYIANR